MSIDRSFISTSRLFSEEKYEKLCNNRVGIIGLGGVGSWAAEALARSGLKKLVLVDFDHISESNINRQVQATVESLGMSKTKALSKRLFTINPRIEIKIYDGFFSAKNRNTIFDEQHTDFWIDACDDLSAKLVLINSFKKKEIKKNVLICGAAGGKTDPFTIIHTDLSKTEQDPLLSKLRYTLRKNHNFSRAGKMDIPVLFSNQSPKKTNLNKSSRISCLGYGSIVTVTATFGMKACFIALSELMRLKSITK